MSAESTGLDWATIALGQKLPDLEFPITYTTVAIHVAGTRGINPIHHDPDFARSRGFDDIFMNTMWYQGLVGRYVSEWAGPESFLRSLRLDIRRSNGPGDMILVRGTVVGKHDEDNGRGLVDLDIRLSNPSRRDSVISTVTVEVT